MDQLIETFHIDAKMMLAQAVNFFVVLTVLYYFAIKPLTRNMQERSNEIEKGLQDAKMSEDSLRRAKEDYRKTIKDARKEADLIVREAAKESDLKRQKAVGDAKGDIEAIIKREKESVLKERELIIEDIKEKTSEFVSLATEKVMRNEMDKKRNEAVLKEALESMDLYKRTAPNR